MKKYIVNDLEQFDNNFKDIEIGSFDTKEQLFSFLSDHLDKIEDDKNNDEVDFNQLFCPQTKLRIYINDL